MRPPMLQQSLQDLDPEVATAIAAEGHRQESTLEMIARRTLPPVP
jgi:glycine hydroxymethyltransferase